MIRLSTKFNENAGHRKLKSKNTQLIIMRMMMCCERVSGRSDCIVKMTYILLKITTQTSYITTNTSLPI